MRAGDHPYRILLTADAIGGVWHYATDLARSLEPLGFETILTMLGPPLNAGQRALAGSISTLQLIETGLPLDWLAEDAASIRQAGRRIAEIAGDLGAVTVQLNAPSLAAGTRFPAPVVAVTHSCVATWWDAVGDGPLPNDFIWRQALMADGLRVSDHVVAPSAAFATATMQSYGLAACPTVVLNGRSALPGSLSNSLCGSPPALQDFAFTAGRLWDRGKDATTLDRAAGYLDGIPFKAAGALEGPQGEAIRFNHLIALGQLDDARLGSCLASRPVFVSAARYEPFGLAVLEAAAAGCALILADTPTFRELWQDAAIFVQPGHARGFANMIEAIIRDKGWRLDLGAAARRRSTLYTPELMASAMASLHRQLANPSSRANAAA